MNKLVSILLPTYNSSPFIARAITSVLQQTYQSWELIIIDDGSTDTTENIVHSFNDKRIVYIKNEVNLGIQRSLNKGLNLAKGEYIARIDDDDYWITPIKLQEQVHFLEINQEYVLVGTDAMVVDDRGVVISKNIMPKSDQTIRSKILSKNTFLHSTIVMRAPLVKSSGGYSEDKILIHAEDYELWLRLGQKGRFQNLSLLSAAITVRVGSLTNANRFSQAKHVFTAMSRYKNVYPFKIKGYCTSVIRIVFFGITTMVPFPKTFFFFLQRMYRK